MPQFDLGGDLEGYKLVPVCQQIQITQTCQCSKEGGHRGTAKHFPTVDKRPIRIMFHNCTGLRDYF